ncbi:MAG: CHAT domain-containing protein [Caldilineaceae bacterium]
MAADARPVLFLAFANEQEDSANYLRNLPEERRRLLAVLDREAAPYTVAQYPNLTIDELVAGLQRYNHRIALFHYGGHSDNSYLLLESAASKREFAHAGGLAKLLAQQHGLHLVFLNGCFNRDQADLLLDAGVPVVVATNSEIEDDAALAFATRFYEALAGNATVQAAFDLAAGAVELQKGQLAAQDLPWELCFRDQTAAEWRLADAIDDPCWGLPPLPRGPLPEHPYRGLAWYRREDADLFFGRCAEIRDLLERVTNDQGAPILLFYGQSGVGKSSLLDAGLIPRLEGTAHCIYLRHSKSESFVPALRRALGAPGAAQSVRDAWLACAAVHSSPVVVILDQVEMLFAQANAQSQPSAELEDLLLAVQSLFGGAVMERPCGKLVLSFRKEYLAEVETTLAGKTLPHAKVFVEPLSRRGVIEAVLGIVRTPHLQQQYGLTVTDDLASQIADDLLEDTESPLAPTLQVLLTKLWEQATARNRAQPTFDAALYRQVKREGLALGDFLTRQLAVVEAQNPAASTSGLVLDLLHFCTTPVPGAAQRTSAELQQMYRNQPPEDFSALLQQCKSAYLLVDGAEDRAADTSTRLAHDAIAPLVRERFARSDAPGQRARRTLENRAVEWQDGGTGALFDDRDLALVEQGESGMRARSPDEERLLRSSQAARSRRRQVRVSLGLAALLVLLFFLVYAGVVALRDQVQEDSVARQESQWLADLSLQQLLVDPVERNVSQAGPPFTGPAKAVRSARRVRPDPGPTLWAAAPVPPGGPPPVDGRAGGAGCWISRRRGRRPSTCVLRSGASHYLDHRSPGRIHGRLGLDRTTIAQPCGRYR